MKKIQISFNYTSKNFRMGLLEIKIHLKTHDHNGTIIKILKATASFNHDLFSKSPLLHSTCHMEGPNHCLLNYRTLTKYHFEKAMLNLSFSPQLFKTQSHITFSMKISLILPNTVNYFLLRAFIIHHSYFYMDLNIMYYN